MDIKDATVDELVAELTTREKNPIIMASGKVEGNLFKASTLVQGNPRECFSLFTALSKLYWSSSMSDSDGVEKDIQGQVLRDLGDTLPEHILRQIDGVILGVHQGGDDRVDDRDIPF